MCGISGISGIIDLETAKRDLDRMQNRMHHRGPDSRNNFIEDKIALGHNRLSIIDLSDHGTQPLYNEDKSLVLIFNGEIYNYKEIRVQLEAKGHVFKTQTDSEVIIHLFEEEGENTVNLIRGMFAFAIYNRINGELFLARDHFGIKPLYYFEENGIFAFASEMKALRDINSNFKISEQAIVNHLTFLWCPFPQTLAKNVKKLEPGSFIKIKDGQIIQHHQFYEINFDGKINSLTTEDAINQLDNLLENSIKEQLVSDVPVGLFLSGGLDSSLIAAYVRKLKPNQKIQAFTIDIQGADMEGNPNDLPYARKVAQKLNIDLEEIIISPQDVLKYIEELTYILDEPLADPAAINVLLITKIATEKGYKVLLSGAGGDDIFTGYRRHKAIVMDEKLNRLPSILKNIIASLSKNIPVKNNKLRKLRKYLENIDTNINDRLTGYYTWTNVKLINSILSDNFKNKLGDYSPQKELLNKLNAIPNENRLINKMLFWELKYFLVDHNLNYTDKMSMYNSVETRVPFLDQRIVDFATKMDVKLKINEGQAKWILKKVAEKYLDNDIIYRKKTGFGAPLRNWIKNDFDFLFDKYLNKETLDKQGVFNHDEIQNLILLNKNGKIDAAYTIFSVICITIWISKMIES